MRLAPAQLPGGLTTSRRRKAFGSMRTRRDLCPSRATRRMVDVSAHMVDAVLPRVQHRQWVLSMP